jgi:hypothetical protein
MKRSTVFYCRLSRVPLPLSSTFSLSYLNLPSASQIELACTSLRERGESREPSKTTAKNEGSLPLYSFYGAYSRYISNSLWNAFHCCPACLILLSSLCKEEERNRKEKFFEIIDSGSSPPSPSPPAKDS